MRAYKIEIKRMVKPMNEMFTVGKIVNTHGVKGELKIVPTTEDPKRFAKLKSIFVEGRKQMTAYEIESVRYHKEFVLLKLKGIDDMNVAQLLKGSSLKIDRKDSLPLKKDEYYISDLFGMEVYTNDERFLGVLVDIIETGSNDVYVVKKEDRQKDLLLPAIKQVIKEIDVAQKRMVVELLEGLEELCE